MSSIVGKTDGVLPSSSLEKEPSSSLATPLPSSTTSSSDPTISKSTDPNPNHGDEKTSPVQRLEKIFNLQYDAWNASVESQRLQNQHRLTTSMTGGDPILVPLEEHKATKEKKQHGNDDRGLTVLDAATGSGIWLSDVHKKYPEAELWGCDLLPEVFLSANGYAGTGVDEGEDGIRKGVDGPSGDSNPDQRDSSTPANPSSITPSTQPKINFFPHDLTQPLPTSLHNKFDLVNMRLTMLWIKRENWDKVLKNLIEVLKPGGWIQIIDASLVLNHPTRNGLKSDYLRSLRIISRIWLESSQVPSTWGQTTLLPSYLVSAGFDPSFVKSRTVELSTGAIAQKWMSSLGENEDGSNGDSKQQTMKTTKLDNTEGCLDPKEVIRLTEVQMLSIIKAYAKRCFHSEHPEEKAKVEELKEPSQRVIYGNKWISLVDGEEERFPVDEAEWDALVASAADEIKTEGNSYDLWIVTGRKGE